MADRNVDVVECDEGDAAIVDGYRRYNEQSRKRAILFSNDFGFVDRAQDAEVRAQHVDFPRQLPKRTTATWENSAICSTAWRSGSASSDFLE